MNCPVCGIETPDPALPCPRCAPVAPGVGPDDAGLFSAATGALVSTPLAEIRFAPGAVFGARYTIVEAIGGGGMGRVYKALDRQVNRTVALKLIRPDLAERGDILARFRRELALAQQVTHPNVCRVHDMGEMDGVPFISMEFVQGQTLADLIRSVGRLSALQTVALGRQMCAGLAAIHDKGIVHRDLKPSNVMVDREGHAVLMDFGVARGPGQEQVTAAGAVAGTLHYAAPEQLRHGTTGARSDLYALGLTLYEMLTGRRPPGDRGGLPLALRDRSERCPPPSELAADVTRSLDAIVMRCLAREPDKRFASAQEVGAKLAELDQTSTGAFKLTPSDVLSTVVLEPIRDTWRRRAWLCLAVGAVVVALAGLGLGRLLGGGRSRGAVSARNALALLPLGYEGPQDTAYLRHMIPVVLGERLRGVQGLELVPYASSRSFDPDESVAGVQQALGARCLLKGRLRLEETRATVELALLCAGAREPVWQRTLTGEAVNLADQAGALAGDLSRPLGVTLAGRGPRAVDREAMEHFLRGRACLESWDEARNLARAEGELRQAVERDPQFAEAHAGLARALWTEFSETRDPSLVDAALQSAQRAVQLDESLSEGHLSLGVVLLGQGEAQRALSEFKRAQELAPADDSVCRRIAQAYAALGDFQRADAMFQRAIDLRPGFWQSYNSMGALALQRSQPSVAIPLFEKMTQLRPSAFAGWSNLGNSYLLAGQPEKALPCLETARRLRASAATQSNLGVALYFAGHYERAVEAFRAAQRTDAEQPSVLRNLGDALRHARQDRDARAAYARGTAVAQQLLRLNRNDRESLRNLAVCAAGSGDCRHSREFVAELEKAQPDDAWAHYHAAVALTLCGDRAQARAQADRAAAFGLAGYVSRDPDLRMLDAAASDAR